MFSVFIINCMVVAIVVLVHYYALFWVTRLIPKLRIKHRYRIVVGVFAALLAHAVEIWVFALAYYFKMQTGLWGTLIGNSNGSISDCAYFSFTVYTTLGFGDIEPIGELRYLTGIESLTGLVLISWTASFLYVEMQKQWKTG